MDRMRTLQVVN